MSDIDNKVVLDEVVEYEEAPSFWKVMWKEIVHDKLALVSFIIFTAILLSVMIASMFIDSEAGKKVNLGAMNKPPLTQGYILGTDPNGRDMLVQLIEGAKNSFVIAFSVTIICAVAGVIIGLIAGYFGGTIDNIVMRIIDFLTMLPQLMLIIVVVSIIPKYTVFSFVLIMSALGWMGKARLIRAKTLQQSSLDYVSASKTLGTPNIVIMFREVLPNIVSIIVVNLTLSLAYNMGLETGLSFLGFGLPFNTASLGTLLSYAGVLENMQNRPWQWLPAALLILVMVLCINFVGQAISRAADAKQRV